MNKYIIVTDWLANYITKEPYLFAKKLELSGWNIIFLSKLDIEKLKKYMCIVLCITYDDLDISKIKCDNNYIIYKIDDLYPVKEIRKKCIEFSNMIIGPYQYLFNTPTIMSMYPKLHKKHSYTVSYSAVDEYYSNIEFNNNPIRKIFVSGAISDVYPLRKYIITSDNMGDYIEVLKHPTYESYKHNIINGEYYKKLNNYICCFTDALVYEYVLLKIFEICSVGSLLLVEDSISTELNKLGFYDQVNCIMCNKSNIQSKADWILDVKNKDSLDKMRKAGMELVRNNHTTSIRANKFNNIIDKEVTDNKIIFQSIYNNKLWNDGRKDIPLSGPGSSLANTSKCSKVLNDFIYSNNCKSVLDLGCGDLTWISKTSFFKDKDIKYTGVDVVESLISSHIVNYPEKKFLCKDIVKYNELEEVSLIILRDVIFHLTNKEILCIFCNIKNKYEYIMITSNKNEKNKEEFDKWRYSKKNIHIEPFNKSLEYEKRVDEERFNGSIYIYSHKEFNK